MRTGFAIGLAIGALSSVFTPDEGEAPENALQLDGETLQLNGEDLTLGEE